jgi:LysR family hydrogen peroxide-inducible transcriptional activator
VNLRDLEYLVAVADARSFRQAAAACEVSQPTLSTQLKKLETELGVTLVDRSAPPLTLTSVGERIVARARVILEQVKEIRQEAALDRDAEGGALRLGAFPTLGPYLLPHVVAGVRERFPALKLLLTEEKSADLLAMLEAGRLDAVLLALPVSEPGLHVEPLFREELLLAVPETHPLADARAPLTPARVAGTELVCLTEGHCLSDQVTAWIHHVGGRRREDYRASSLEVVRNMVSAGTAATLLPALAVLPPVATAPGLVVRRFARSAPARDIALVWRSGAPQGELLHKLATTLVPSDVPDKLVVPLAAGRPVRSA